MIYHLSFDVPPSLNRLYRYGKGKVYLSEAGKVYKQEIALLAFSQGVRDPLEGAIRFTMRVYGWRGDLDNTLKITCDALNGVAYHDDSAISELHIYRLPDDGDKRIELDIEVIE